MNNNVLDKLNNSNVDWSSLDVKSLWNTLENLIINVIDELAPLKQFEVCHSAKCEAVPIFLKQKINKRNRLLKQNKVLNLPFIREREKNRLYIVSSRGVLQLGGHVPVL